VSNLPSDDKTIFPKWLIRFSVWLSKLSKVKWWLTVLTVFSLITVISYWITLFAVDANILTIIKQFPLALREHFSIETWWLERLFELTIPMFLSIALSIQLARLSEDDSQTIKRLVPWLPTVKDFFAVKLPVFFVATAGVFTGMVTLLVIGGPEIDLKPLILLPVTIGMLMIAFVMKVVLSEDPSKGPFGTWTMKHHKCITICLVLASASFWLTANWVLPILARIELYQFGKTLL